MKITIDIDCTPQEARAFLGLPDLEPMQAAFMDGLQGRMEQALAGADLETLMKTWMPGGMPGLDAMQKAFWNAATGKRDDSS
ncbi:MAG: DUF6489 family protein [Alphaproteobacteria bacterium]|jgi:hypothetical protein|nr:DUF6489 family protein [Alphaproteobacteria bacterium]|tara:strand:+ start:660 stop:905 length:246 start_codon:yes stop_codon:yes gene_type:complete